jgi:hypothetical protein
MRTPVIYKKINGLTELRSFFNKKHCWKVVSVGQRSWHGDAPILYFERKEGIVDEGDKFMGFGVRKWKDMLMLEEIIVWNKDKLYMRYGSRQVDSLMIKDNGRYKMLCTVHEITETR